MPGTFGKWCACVERVGSYGLKGSKKIVQPPSKFSDFPHEKFFQEIFWLEIWWDVIRHQQNTGSAILRRFVSAYWQKIASKAKKKSWDIAPFDPHQNKFQFFWSSSQKHGLYRHFYVESWLYFQHFWFELYSFSNGSSSDLIVLGNVKTTLNNVTRNSPARTNYLKTFVDVFRIQGCLHLLSQSIKELFPIIVLPTTILSAAVVNVFEDIIAQTTLQVRWKNKFFLVYIQNYNKECCRTTNLIFFLMQFQSRY